MSRILIVDDELSLRQFLALLLSKEGYDVTAVEGVLAAYAALDEGGVDLVLTDLRMPDGSGLDVLTHAMRLDPAIQVIVMTAYATTQTAIDAMKAGARDYLVKPFDVEKLLVQVGKALEVRRLESENLYLRQELASRGKSGQVVGSSEPMQEIHTMVARVAPTRATVLITGESGTGKEVIAREIHQRSDRAQGPFIPVNCGAIPETLIESELFGHIRGAFTGAAKDRKGLFFAAEGGTLFLDEIGELPLSMQVRLLRALQEKKIKRVGAEVEENVDVRIVAATNRDLMEEVTEGRFREDLYYRLNVIQLRVPPLRERREDVPLLVRHFLTKLGAEHGREMKGVDREAMQALMAHEWPGNVRELENVMERAITLSWGDMITLDALPKALQPSADLPSRLAVIDLPPEGCVLDALVEALERRLILQALERTGGNRTEAARHLGVTFRSLRYRLAKYKLVEGEGDEEVEEDA